MNNRQWLLYNIAVMNTVTTSYGLRMGLKDIEDLADHKITKDTCYKRTPLIRDENYPEQKAEIILAAQLLYTEFGSTNYLRLVMDILLWNYIPKDKYIPIMHCLQKPPKLDWPHDKTVLNVAMANNWIKGEYKDEALILADAIEDTGFDCPHAVGHLRNNVFHVKGCWVIESLIDSRAKRNQIEFNLSTIVYATRNAWTAIKMRMAYTELTGDKYYVLTSRDFKIFYVCTRKRCDRLLYSQERGILENWLDHSMISYRNSPFRYTDSPIEYDALEIQSMNPFSGFMIAFNSHNQVTELFVGRVT